MSLLKKKNWWICLLLQIVSFGLFTFVLAHYLKVYDEDAWYQNWRYWFFAGICFVFPIFIVAIVFSIQITCEVAAKLSIPGEEIYNTPYSWILCIIIPVIGWSLLIVMYIYIMVWTIVMLAKGNGEKFIEE